MQDLNVITVWCESLQAACAHNLVYILFEIGLLSLLISEAQRHFALQFLLFYGFSFGCGLKLGKGKREAERGSAV